MTNAEQVAVAASIAQSLAERAIWHEDRCNWLGLSAAPAEGAPLTLETLSSGLYAGTSGIALFLADAVAVTDDPNVRRSALAALRHAASHVDCLPPATRTSFFSGWLGVAYAALRTARALNNDEMFALGRSLLERCEFPDEAPVDVVVGRAGAILGLLAIVEIDPDSRLLELAIGQAERVIGAATRIGETWAWSSRVGTGMELSERPLTGYAHGACGIGLALQMLGAKVDRADLQQVAEGAFRYEDSVFNATEQNWPDFREQSSNAGSIAWCHGAPGCGLARLVAMKTSIDGAVSHGARLAVETTLQGLEQVSDRDTSLCHGTGGLTETLLVAASVLHDTNLTKQARATWQRLIDRYGALGGWPSGLPSHQQTPGLMLGVAGIGHALLRANGAARSLLVPGFD